MFVAAVLALAVAGLWLVPPIDDARAMPNAVGTSGTHAGAAENHGGDVITEIETITATTNATELVGRRVDLHVDVQERANDRALWVGSRDNRVLVVIGRDSRDLSDGQRAMISGVIRQVPAAEERFSWDLTKDDQRELTDRKIYIRADTVVSEGHGTY